MVEIDIIKAFDEYLYSKCMHYEAVIIGGAALKLLGVIKRETIDCDVLDPTIPKEIMEASIEFAKTQPLLRSSEVDRVHWLNNGPDSLVNYLPKGWRRRLQDAYKGKAIYFKTLGREDLIATKLLAYCDRGRDKIDLIDLQVNKEEMKRNLVWVQGYDANPGWPEHVMSQLSDLAKDLGYEL